ncbi:hypothetical protein Tco_1079589 [Tanacetum coccineum]|uniref:Uncharacterized protein n=1 Tax=Tanacetum coccineum TaxID=301880 RepID=A0ABQ5HSF2_9ASTR
MKDLCRSGEDIDEIHRSSAHPPYNVYGGGPRPEDTDAIPFKLCSFDAHHLLSIKFPTPKKGIATLIASKDKNQQLLQNATKRRDFPDQMSPLEGNRTLQGLSREGKGKMRGRYQGSNRWIKAEWIVRPGLYPTYIPNPVLVMKCEDPVECVSIQKPLNSAGPYGARRRVILNLSAKSRGGGGVCGGVLVWGVLWVEPQVLEKVMQNI